MAKITLDNILSGFNLSKINSNFQKIQDILNNKVLFRDNPVGEPNTIQQDIDMNGKNILNVGTLGVSTSFAIQGLDLATQVQNAANSATAAANSATQSANSATSSASSLDSFKKQYQGRLASAPTTRYDGSALQIGDLYFDTTLNFTQVYGNSGWSSVGSSVNGTSKRATYTYTTGSPVFTVIGGYDAGYVDVYLNGYKLVRTSDFDDTSGSTITINGTLIPGDIVDIIAYGTFNIANVYTKSESDAYRNAIYSRIGDASSVVGRNRIINGDMRIDQRNNGASQTVIGGTSNTYTVDRMLVVPTGSNVTSQRVAGTGAYQYELLLTGASGNTETQVRHRIESYNCADLKNQTVTVQAELSSSSATSVTWYAYYANSVDTFSSTTQIATGTLTINATPTIKSFSFNAGANAGNGIQLIISYGALGAGATSRISGWQLEVGSVATPFERVDYSEMLRRCQRYCRLVRTASGIAANTTTYQAWIIHEGMRAAPACSTASAVAITDSNTGFTQSTPSISASINSADGGAYTIPNFTGLTQFRSYGMYTSSILLTAEL